jgi:hypothetical protein
MRILDGIMLTFQPIINPVPNIKKQDTGPNVIFGRYRRIFIYTLWQSLDGKHNNKL